MKLLPSAPTASRNWRNYTCRYTALKLFKSWLEFNPRLRHLTKSKTKYFTPKQVKMIVEELGEPFDTE